MSYAIPQISDKPLLPFFEKIRLAFSLVNRISEIKDTIDYAEKVSTVTVPNFQQVTSTVSNINQ